MSADVLTTEQLDEMLARCCYVRRWMERDTIRRSHETLRAERDAAADGPRNLEEALGAVFDALKEAGVDDPGDAVKAISDLHERALEAKAYARQQRWDFARAWRRTEQMRRRCNAAIDEAKRSRDELARVTRERDEAVQEAASVVDRYVAVRNTGWETGITEAAKLLADRARAAMKQAQDFNPGDPPPEEWSACMAHVGRLEALGEALAVASEEVLALANTTDDAENANLKAALTGSKPDSVAELGKLLTEAGLVVYLHDPDCAGSKGGACDRSCRDRTIARREQANAARGRELVVMDREAPVDDAPPADETEKR